MRDTNFWGGRAERVLPPTGMIVNAEGGPTRASASGLDRAARIATWIWAVVSAVNFVIWLMVCIISGSTDAPWWAWEVGPGGVVVGALWLAARSYRRSSSTSFAMPSSMRVSPNSTSDSRSLSV